MNTATKSTFIVNRLVPMWHAMRSGLVKPSVATSANHDRSFKVKRAGRVLTLEEYQKLENTYLTENTNSTKGGGSNVAIQFGFLGGFGGFSILGESPG